MSDLPAPPTNSAFDWTAIGAVAAAAAALAQLIVAIVAAVSLWLMWRQIKLTRKQVSQSMVAYETTLRQINEQSRRAEQARHDAVFPDLEPRISSAQVGDDPNTTVLHYEIRNHGEGSAHQLRIICKEDVKRFCNINQFGFQPTASAVSIPKGGTQKLSILVMGRVHHTLHMTWLDQYEKEFGLEWNVSETSGGFRQFIPVEAGKPLA